MMRLKHIITFVTVAFLASCGAFKRQGTALDNIIVYDNFDPPLHRGGHPHSLATLPEILILKRQSRYPELNSYEHYFEDNASIVGKWKVENDTLYLFPLYEYKYDPTPQVTDLHLIDNQGPVNEYRIDQKWLIVNDKIYKRSNLSAYVNQNDDMETNMAVSFIGYNPQYFLTRRTRAKLK